MSEIIGLDQVRRWEGEGEGRLDILRGVTLSVQSGEFVAIMGPSGSGKSTLLNLVGLLDLPNAGTVRFLGEDVTTFSEDRLSELRNRSVGFIFQGFHLLPYLTVRQNVLLPRMYAGQGGGDERARELLERVKLSHRLDAYPATLSGGERQRVAITRALINDPKLILADEPTGALDSVTGAQTLQLISELHNAGATVVMITHDEWVAGWAERTLAIRDGRLE